MRSNSIEIMANIPYGFCMYVYGVTMQFRVRTSEGSYEAHLVAVDVLKNVAVRIIHASQASELG